MRVENPDLLTYFRSRPACELCGLPTPFGTHPHHVHTRGAGQLDIALNLVALDPACHQLVHAGKVPRQRLLEVVAEREGVLPEEVERAVWRLRRRPKP